MGKKPSRRGGVKNMELEREKGSEQKGSKSSVNWRNWQRTF